MTPERQHAIDDRRRASSALEAATARLGVARKAYDLAVEALNVARIAESQAEDAEALADSNARRNGG